MLLPMLSSDTAATKIHIKIIHLHHWVLSFSPQQHLTTVSPYTHNGPCLAAIPPRVHPQVLSVDAMSHIHPQVLFANTTSPPTLAMSNATLSPSHHVYAHKPLSTNGDKDVLPLLRNLPCTLAIPLDNTSPLPPHTFNERRLAAASSFALYIRQCLAAISSLMHNRLHLAVAS